MLEQRVKLGIDGFQYRDLYDNQRLADLTIAFDRYVERNDGALFGRFDGYRFAMSARPHLRAIQANFLTLHVTRPNGTPATFTPWFGALAHAIFFQVGTLTYFHTHVCGPNTPGCTSVFGGAKVTGTSSKPGKLQVGVLLPVAGTWRLFLQFQAGGRVITAPFTLKVR